MIRITVEIVPGGDESKAFVLTTAKIANDGIGRTNTGNYNVTLMKQRLYHLGVWKTGRVVAFPRQAMGARDLIYRALAATVGARNGGR